MIDITQTFQYLKIFVAAWVTATAYKVGDYVLQGGTVYECLVGHTSGTFATDLAANKWSSDTLAEKARTSAISDVISYCNRDFRTAQYTEEKKAVNSSRFFVNNYPIDTADDKITVIKYLDESTGDWTDIIDGSGDTINNSTYRKSFEIRLLKSYSFPEDAIIRVTYYSNMTGWPGLDKVEQCCLELAKLSFDNSFHSRLAKTSENLGGASDTGAGFDFKGAKDMILQKLDEFRNGNA